MRWPSGTDLRALRTAPMHSSFGIDFHLPANGGPPTYVLGALPTKDCLLRSLQIRLGVVPCYGRLPLR